MRTFAIALAWLLGIALVGGGVAFVYFQAQFASYADARNHFVINYPKAWNTVHMDQPTASVVGFTAPKTGAMKVFFENLTVTVQPVPGHLATMQKFSDTIRKQMTAVFKTNINIVEDRDIPLGGYDGHRMTFLAPNPDRLQMVCAWTIRSDKAYIITFICKTYQYKDYELPLRYILETFKLQ